jgi:DHA1 family tetracycline resistance protein-like MFS transporter
MAEATTTPSPSSSPSSNGRAAFLFIFITIALDFLAFGIIAPVLPNLIIQFEAGNISRAAAITGYFGFAWATMQFLFSPILGAWSDRFGRRPIILLSCFGLGLDYIFMALAPSLGWLFVGRLISGITSSNIASAFAYVTDVTPPEKRAKQFGLLSAAFGLGFIVGPAVGGLLGHINLRLPFWGAAVYTPHYTHECEKKGDRKWAIRKWLKRKNRILFGGSENT